MAGRYDGAVENTSTVSEAGIPRQAHRSQGAEPAVSVSRGTHGALTAETESSLAASSSGSDTADTTEGLRASALVSDAWDAPESGVAAPADPDAALNDAASNDVGVDESSECDVPVPVSTAVVPAASAAADARPDGVPASILAPAAPATDERAGEQDTQPPTKRARRQGPRWQMTLAVSWLAGLSTLIVLGHRFLPDMGGLGSLLDTTLPWWCVPIAALLLWALLLRTGLAVGMALLAVLAWGLADGRALLPRGSSGTADLRIVSQDVSIDQPDLGAIGALATTRHADVLALQNLPASVAAAPTLLDDIYPYHVGMYEFGVWSRFPITSAKVASFATGTGVTALRVVIDTPRGYVALYDVHLPVPSLSEHGFAGQRDTALDALGSTLRAEHLPHFVVVGDLDTAPTDRAMSAFERGGLGLLSAQSAAGSGFGFTWPSRLPLARLDDVLTHDMTALRASVLPPTGSSSAHRPIQADLRF